MFKNTKTSTILIIGIVLILVGCLVASFEYLQSKKNKAFSEMNIMLFEEEMPKNIATEEEIKQEPDIETDEEVEKEEPAKPSTPAKYNYLGVLEIPKLNIKRGFLPLTSRYNSVNYNITVINGSTMPDTSNNNLILAAHSGNCSICYFDKLYKLAVGDYAYVYYSGIKYIYKIVNIYEAPKTGTIAISRNKNKNTLTLITCTRNSNTKQTVYILELDNKVNY